MKRFATLALLCVSSVAAASPSWTPEQVRAEVEQKGAQAFFAGLNERDADALFDDIGSGKTAWVALAPKLAEGADAGNAEGLGIALAEALPKNAEAVLAVTDPVDIDGHSLAVSRVCGIPFIETVPPGYKAKALRAVRKVHSPQLRAIRARCVAVLQKS